MQLNSVSEIAAWKENMVEMQIADHGIGLSEAIGKKLLGKHTAINGRGTDKERDRFRPVDQQRIY